MIVRLHVDGLTKNRKLENQSIYHSRLYPVTESSAETLNAGGETVRPAPVQARFDEAGSKQQC